MTHRPERIQGTDGIRGEVLPSDDPRLAGRSPIQAFVDDAIITPELVEMYARAWAELLRASGLADDGGFVALAADPRDEENLLSDAAIRGISSAGLEVADLGIMPTPALAMYVVASGASGGLMLTASHNPAEQNGIKLFLPGTGLKLYPNDDLELTRLLYEVADNPPDSRERGAVRDAHDEARGMLKHFFSQRFNTWLADSHDLNAIALVVDCANGAWTPHVRELLEPFNFRHLELVGADPDGMVNDGCGAGWLEGHSLIDAGFHSDKGVDFRSMQLIQALFRHGRAGREELKQGAFRVVGAAFDADGDRCYCCEYDPFQDAVIIHSGDEIAFTQARYFKKIIGDSMGPATTFVTTVESDLNVSVAAEELGYIPAVTGVGDKWLLWEAWCSQLGTWWDLLEARSNDMTMLADLEQVREEFEEMPEPNARGVLFHMKAIREVARVEEIDLDMISIDPAMLGFAIGAEESGHAVTAGIVGLQADGPQRVGYFGNALKSAVNWLAATDALGRDVSGPSEFFALQAEPFPPGVKATFPVYYTDKSLLHKDSDVYRSLRAAVLDMLKERFAGRYEPVVQTRNEEPDLLYIVLQEQRDKEEPVNRAAIFIRNSGTEAKTSVYVRCSRTVEDELIHIARKAVVLLAQAMKDPDSRWAQAERKVLDLLAEKQTATFDELSGMLVQVPARQLIIEMSLKQRLIEPQGQALQLTELGKQIQEVHGAHEH